MNTKEDESEWAAESIDPMMDQEHVSEPKDRFHIAYILFYVLGVLTNVHVNFFTTATDYWMYKFRDINAHDNSTNRTELQAHFTANYSIVSSASSILFVLITVILAKKIGLITRTVFSISGILLIFIVTVIFVGVDTDPWQNGFYILTLGMGALLACCSSVFMITLFQMVGRFPPNFLAGILSGQSICGILSALIQIIVLAIGAGSLESGLIYFLIGLVFVLFTIVYYVVAFKWTIFFRYNMTKEMPVLNRPKWNKDLILGLLNKMKYYLISLCLVLGSSIMTHPGVTALVVSVNKGNGNDWNDIFFTPVVTFLFYNLFDYVGREMAGYFRIPKSGLLIVIISCVRIVLVPLIMFCNAQPRDHLPVVFAADYAYIIFIIIFSMTNGYLVNLCALQIPLICTREEINLALGFTALTIIASVGLCSFFSALLVTAL